MINDTRTTFKKKNLRSGKTYQLKTHGSSTVPPRVGGTSSAAAVPTKSRIASFPSCPEASGPRRVSCSILGPVNRSAMPYIVPATTRPFSPIATGLSALPSSCSCSSSSSSSSSCSSDSSNASAGEADTDESIITTKALLAAALSMSCRPRPTESVSVAISLEPFAPAASGREMCPVEKCEIE
eukprot:CAMPEP_0179442198 /NCGR_PEP_ID=MMETSP0799-20121207/25695_1 /TAXON_ID=46947 /ORGANISM="Geminigera cryophila, Strain CCMP2564" /LENGTH=182 /DNA_ID=CAMNT_0021227103 /DNA_START=1085 /DNA_END=1633 /DNA_ORIENTATION=+